MKTINAFRLYIFLIACVGMGCITSAQNRAGINISLWKNLCTQPYDSLQTTYLNVGLLSQNYNLYGMGANVLGTITNNDTKGVQLSGLANLTKGNMYGLQIAGISNISGNKMVGLSLSGLVNIAGNNSKGVIISGLTNISGDQIVGLTIGGLLNVVGKQTKGIQISGLSNIAGEDFKGIELSGILNVVGENLNGLQLSTLANITGHEMKGVQIGLFNYATHMKGIQLGLINYNYSHKQGLQLGLANLNPNTNIDLLIYGNNLTAGNFGVRFKNNMLYTIVGVGAYQTQLEDKFSLTFSYRAGLSIPVVHRLDIIGDAGFEHIEAMSNHNEVIPHRLHAWSLRAGLEYICTQSFGIFAMGGYSWTRRYKHSGCFKQGALIEGGIIISPQKKH